MLASCNRKDADGALGTRAASWLGIHAGWLKPALVPVARRLDDWLGHSKRNPAKKWWFDHEMVDGVAVEAKATNRRDIGPGRKLEAAAQKIAFYPASLMPPPDATGPVPVDRKAALAMRALLETPEEAQRRVANGGPAPDHYRPAPPAGASAAEGSAAPREGPYRG